MTNTQIIRFSEEYFYKELCNREDIYYSVAEVNQNVKDGDTIDNWLVFRDSPTNKYVRLINFSAIDIFETNNERDYGLFQYKWIESYYVNGLKINRWAK